MRALIAGLVFAFGASMHAQKLEGCPWLNAATAGGVLGGEVRMSVTETARSGVELPNGAPPDATCEFTRISNTIPATLRIVVRTPQDRAAEYAALVASCGPSPRRLVGIGNEAMGCSLTKGATSVEQVVARVRHRIFALTISQPAGAADTGMQGKLQNTAEQIAGSLF